jgi:hypothetical protein
MPLRGTFTLVLNDVFWGGLIKTIKGVDGGDSLVLSKDIGIKSFLPMGVFTRI